MELWRRGLKELWRRGLRELIFSFNYEVVGGWMEVGSGGDVAKRSKHCPFIWTRIREDQGGES